MQVKFDLLRQTDKTVLFHQEKVENGIHIQKPIVLVSAGKMTAQNKMKKDSKKQPMLHQGLEMLHNLSTAHQLGIFISKQNSHYVRGQNENL